MQNHPSHAALAPFLSKYPQSSGPLFQAYNDIVLAQKWTEIALLDVPSCQRGAIRGTRPLAPTDPDAPRATCVVLPVSLSEEISTRWLRNAFADLAAQQAASGTQSGDELYLAIAADDASTVFYKLSRGIVKPPV
ncbi:hypothetical protein CONPUDRAFT_124153 [Coniophora puteana RWD-64-598 SS2]|uniref:tRNA-splicing endonuclease subunit Sen15 domain-containing protein n=1 Tax=Coniophora puteana (strain RWD-64-598) TaxID=741705 RepID=A0A5M3MR91_CONPW|nr:uncharacterized protein CONPUDRAFT_124153 [Coniophora puteana RWD-64-598 SS2]EIW81175.1 hypothetical protein CONPUDRAFT_124153 [Coniophora puteana RWD-64-598 SS2]